LAAPLFAALSDSSGSEHDGDGFEQRKIHRPKNVNKYARPALNGNRAAPLQEFGMLLASTLSTMSK